MDPQSGPGSHRARSGFIQVLLSSFSLGMIYAIANITEGFMTPDIAQAQIGKFVVATLEASGRQPLFFGRQRSATEVGSPVGLLPVIYAQAAAMALILDDQDGRQKWLDGFSLVPDTDSLVGRRLQIDHVPATGLAPVISLFYDSLQIAMSLTPDQDSIEFSHLVRPVPLTTLKALSIPSWPGKDEETLGEMTPSL